MDPTLSFDQDLSLAELLPEKEREPLLALFSRLLGATVRLVAPDAEAIPGWPRVLLKWNLEPVAILECLGEHLEQLQVVGNLLQTMMNKNALYQMVSALHLEAVHADYAALQEKHAALVISETRYRELAARLEERVQEQVAILRQAELTFFEEARLASVGRLASGVAHEINNPLAFIQANLSSAGDYVRHLQQFRNAWQQQGPEAANTLWDETDLDYALTDFDALLKESLDGVRRAAAIVKDLRLFSGVDGEEHQEENLEALLKVVLRLLATEQPANVTVTEAYQNLPPYPCQPSSMGQLFQNLLRNAYQAVAAGGRVIIRTGRTDDSLVIEFQDNGRGIPPENLGKIFDPFFTTLEVGQGAGLGLTVSREVVRKQGGRIEVSSQPGAGSLFRIILPLRSR